MSVANLKKFLSTLLEKIMLTEFLFIDTYRYITELMIISENGHWFINLCRGIQASNIWIDHHASDRLLVCPNAVH